MQTCKEFNEYLSCPKYNNPATASFSLHYGPKGEQHHYVNLGISTIVFMLEGVLEFSYEKFFRKRLSAGQFILIPSGVTVDVTILEECKSIRCRFDVQMQMCEYFRLDQFEATARENSGEVHVLHVNDTMQLYLASIESYLNGRFLCSCLGKHKHQELMYLLRSFYSPHELACFFAPVINKDIYFMDGVRRNYPGSVTVAELARKMNYSVSGFNKRFERCFGQSAHSWMQKQRSEDILRELRTNAISNKEIIYRYNFSSEARFYEFCKAKWGRTPGEIRKGAVPDGA